VRNFFLAPGATFSWHRNHNKEFQKYCANEDQLVSCFEIPNVVHHLGKESYDASDWDLFIDYLKRSLKAVLPHCGNILASMSIAHSVHLKETYEN